MALLNQPKLQNSTVTWTEGDQSNKPKEAKEPTWWKNHPRLVLKKKIHSKESGSGYTNWITTAQHPPLVDTSTLPNKAQKS
jgi:hypothetical protein